jgi:hypothetical protein
MDELGDWIPVGIDLYRKPKFVALCRAMQASRFEAAGRVLAVWFWIQSYGPQTALDASGVDEAAAVPPGTTEALIASGWATASRRSGGGIRFSWPGETLAEIRNRRSASARRAASARWHGGPTDADAMRPHSDCNAKSKSKSESKNKTESLEPIGSRLVQADVETSSARTDRRRRQPREDSIGWSASNGFAGVSDADRTAWSAAYPAVDIDAELAKAHAWLAAASPSERWRNVRSGLRRWMARSQGYADRRGNANGLTGPTPRRILPLGCYFDADGIARTASGARLD